MAGKNPAEWRKSGKTLKSNGGYANLPRQC